MTLIVSNREVVFFQGNPGQIAQFKASRSPYNKTCAAFTADFCGQC